MRPAEGNLSKGHGNQAHLIIDQFITLDIAENNPYLQSTSTSSTVVNMLPSKQIIEDPFCWRAKKRALSAVSVTPLVTYIARDACYQALH